MPIFGRKSKLDDKTFFSLDIGTEFVKVLVCDIEEDNVVILGFGKERQPLNAMKGGVVTNIKSVVSTCQKAIDLAMEGLDMDIPKKTVIGIAGELVKGVGVKINYEREDPEQKIDEAEIKRILDKIHATAHDEAIKKFTDATGSDKTQIKLINATVTDTFIDDYKISSPIGFQGKKVTLNIYFVYTPLVFAGALDDILKQLDLTPIITAVQPFAIARSVKGSRDLNFDAIIIDVGGGTTDIALVTQGSFQDTKMFAMGGRSFTKRIASDLQISYEDAEKAKIEYAEMDIDKALSLKVRDAVKKDLDLWISGIEISLEDMEDVKVYPDQILLCGGGSKLQEIRSKLVEYPWSVILPFHRNPKINFLSPEKIDGIVDKTLQLTRPEDVTPVALARIVLDIMKDDVIVAI
ncbi:MAG: cell division FtsA domain-containing protein [Patescibacteria group bacterium]|jgi:cell division protein FtsA